MYSRVIASVITTGTRYRVFPSTSPSSPWMENKNEVLLIDFTRYCQTRPDLRFWQALLNWAATRNSRIARISAEMLETNPEERIAQHLPNEVRTTDTYYWGETPNEWRC